MASAEAQQAYKLRARIVEPVYGWAKNNHGMRRWSFRGIEKVDLQWKMLCTTINLRAIFKHWTLNHA